MVVIILTKLKNLVGKKVVGVNGESIGEVKDVEFDTTNWRISDMELKLDEKAPWHWDSSLPEEAWLVFSEHRNRYRIFASRTHLSNGRYNNSE